MTNYRIRPYRKASNSCMIVAVIRIINEMRQSGRYCNLILKFDVNENENEQRWKWE